MPTTLSGAPSPAIVQRDPAFTLGIEEEYLLVEPRTGAIAADPPPALMEALVAGSEQSPEGSVTPEFLRAQIEVGTRVCKTVPEASDCLKVLRGLVIAEAERHGLGLIAASTHPFAKWEALQHTDKERYSALAQDLQGPVRRLVICGMHVHVGIEDPDLRIDLMGQLSYFLPHLLALSTSSPFWKGLDSGMMSYRLSVFNELPRTGLPEAFSSYTEYQRHVDALVGAGVIEDSTKIWWDLRPSHRYPTLEMRIADVCTRLEDAVCIAALFVCLTRMLYRLRRENQRWRAYARMLVEENRWRAQRYGLDRGLIDFGKGSVVSMPELVEELLDLVNPDAAALGCVREVQHMRTIVARGSSAHAQRAVYQQALQSGMSEAEALSQVVAHLMAETAGARPEIKTVIQSGE